MTRPQLTGILLVLFSFIGMVDSAYVALKSLDQTVVPCTVTRGCEEVLNSPYARIGGLSIAWSGLLYYMATAAGGVFSLFGFRSVLRLTGAAAVLAFLFTLYLFYLQAFVIRAFCDYCLLSATMVLGVLITHLAARPFRCA